jgi:hypothetical protein
MPLGMLCGLDPLLLGVMVFLRYKLRVFWIPEQNRVAVVLDDMVEHRAILCAVFANQGDASLFTDPVIAFLGRHNRVFPTLQTVPATPRLQPIPCAILCAYILCDRAEPRRDWLEPALCRCQADR